MTALDRLYSLAAEHGIDVDIHGFEDGETVVLEGRQSTVKVKVTRQWGERQSAPEAALVALRTSLGIVGEDDPEAREEV